MTGTSAARLQYLDWLRGVAVLAMVLSHVTDSWIRDADRANFSYYTLVFTGGVASSLFLFLAGVATAMSAASKARREGSERAGAAQARRRGWEIFCLGFVFRLQAQVLSLGPIDNMFKVDMLNVMGLSIVAASYAWQVSPHVRRRAAVFAVITGVLAMATPLVRDVTWLAPLPDPLEAYLRPAGPYSAFPVFAWSGFLFAGMLVGDMVDAARRAVTRVPLLQNGLILGAGAGFMLGWYASFQPSIYPSSSFWNDSPTFFFIRLSLVVLLVPLAYVVDRLAPATLLQPVVTMGRSSLFVYWIHVEMVYGVAAEPLKRALPLWGAVASAALLASGLYVLVLLKNRLLERHELRGPWRLLAPVVR